MLVFHSYVSLPEGNHIILKHLGGICIGIIGVLQDIIPTVPGCTPVAPRWHPRVSPTTFPSLDLAALQTCNLSRVPWVPRPRHHWKHPHDPMQGGPRPNRTQRSFKWATEKRTPQKKTYDYPPILEHGYGKRLVYFDDLPLFKTVIVHSKQLNDHQLLGTSWRILFEGWRDWKSSGTQA
jgi:hypothetical protein